MTSKELLLAQKDLSAWWAGVSHDSRFDQICLILKNDICEMDDIQKIKGASEIVEKLKTLADNPPEPQKFPSVGLQREPESDSPIKPEANAK